MATSTLPDTERVYVDFMMRGVVTAHGVRRIDPTSGYGAEYVWVDCERCGPGRPMLYEARVEKPVRFAYGQRVEMPARKVGSVVTLRKDYREAGAFCGSCGWPARVRFVTDGHKGRRERAKCNGKCLHAPGQNCDCQCHGMCHGAGMCRCV